MSRIRSISTRILCSVPRHPRYRSVPWKQSKLPIRMIAPGRVFRADEVDATHSPYFHQIEGLVVDKNITFADLKGTLAEFAKELFGAETKVKVPSASFPIHRAECRGGCYLLQMRRQRLPICVKANGWIEILGCGMVHPHVLEMCGIDPE